MQLLPESRVAGAPGEGQNAIHLFYSDSPLYQHRPSAPSQAHTNTQKQGDIKEKCLLFLFQKSCQKIKPSSHTPGSHSGLSENAACLQGNASLSL